MFRLFCFSSITLLLFRVHIFCLNHMLRYDLSPRLILINASPIGVIPLQMFKIIGHSSIWAMQFFGSFIFANIFQLLTNIRREKRPPFSCGKIDQKKFPFSLVWCADKGNPASLIKSSIVILIWNWSETGWDYHSQF